MASIGKHGDQWRVQIYAQGSRKSKVFDRLQDAKDWAKRQEPQKQWPKIAILSLEALRALPALTAKDTGTGVYFLWDANEDLAYIGQSRNVAKRIARHQVEPPVAFQTATLMEVPFPWQLAVEQLYIEAYGQPGQREGDFGSRIESYVPNARRAVS